MKSRGAAARVVLTVAGVLLVLAAVPAAPAAAVNGVFAEQVARLHAFDPENTSLYGDAVDIDGDTAVVGAQWASAFQRGAVYVYTRSAAGWAFQAKLSAPTPSDGEWFGSSVAVSGDVIVVGAKGASVGGQGMAGRVYVYRRVGGTWQAPQIIDSPVPHANDRFGSSVAIDGDYFVVGMPGLDDAMGDDHGIAYVYVRSGSTWVLQGPAYDGSPAPYAQLGWSVDISGGRIVAGCPGEDESRGAVIVFSKVGDVWVPSPKIYAPSRGTGDSFGCSVAISGSTIAVGAYGTDAPGPVYDVGAAYAFVNPGAGWVHQASFASPAPAQYKTFGRSVGVDGDIAVVGEPQGGSGEGAAYIYRRSGSTWPGVQTIFMWAATPAVQMFGQDVAISKGTMIIGSYLADSPAVADAGGAFIFSHLEPVYRFYNLGAATHFYTPSAAERDHVIATWPTILRYEGVAYKANPENNTQPLYRFYNKRTNSHFYTVSLAEKLHVEATWPDIYTYEGQTYAVTPWPCAGPTVYRFYNLRNGSHFYTASEEEKAHVIATWPTILRYEGPAFWLGQ